MDGKLCFTLLLAILTCAHCDTCDNLANFITVVEQTVGNELSSLAVKEQPAASRDDEALLNCGRADTCCTTSSEEVLRRASVDLFDTVSFKLMLSQVEGEIRGLREQVANDIYLVTKVADGEFAAEASKRYVLYGDVDVDTIAARRLVNFVEKVYGETYDSSCFDVFSKTRGVVSARIQTLLAQYALVVSGLLEGINLVPAINVVASTSLSNSCKAALNRASMFENIGCKMCSDSTSTIKTCYTLCTNVARGCMRPLLCYVETWNTWITKQDALTVDLIAVSGVRSSFIDELRMVYEVEYAELKEKNWLDEMNCKPTGEYANADAMKALKEHDLSLPSLLIDQHTAQFKSSILSLPTDFCTKSDSVSEDMRGDDSQCWNGTHVAAYIHPTATFDLEDQKCNPEVTPEELPCEDEEREMSCGWYEEIIATEQPQTTSEKPPVNTGPVVEGAVKGSGAAEATSSSLAAVLVVILLSH